MMFGYASNETDAYRPMSIDLANKLTKRLSEVRKSGVLPYLGPDGQSQVTVKYRDGAPIRVDTVVISAQHAPEVSPDVIRSRSPSSYSSCVKPFRCAFDSSTA